MVWAVKHFHLYLYDDKCHVFTVHEALKSLLNTFHPLGKLARWGLALQELELEVHYHPGRHNSTADALSRALLTSNPHSQYGVVAAVEIPCSAAKGGERPLGSRRLEDPTLNSTMEFLMGGKLPQDDKLTRVIALTCSQYALLDGVLC